MCVYVCYTNAVSSTLNGLHLPRQISLHCLKFRLNITASEASLHHLEAEVINLFFLPLL